MAGTGSEAGEGASAKVMNASIHNLTCARAAAHRAATH